MPLKNPTQSASSDGSNGNAPQPTGAPLISIDSALLKDVQVTLEADLGQTSLSIEELLALRGGSIVKLGLKLDDLVNLRLNGAVVARGEIVAVGDHFGIRLVEIAKPT